MVRQPQQGGGVAWRPPHYYIDEASQSEWSDDDDGGVSEPLLGVDRESTGYTTDDTALENASIMNDAGLTDAEGELYTPPLTPPHPQKSL